jgi:hypothetical protein
MLAYAPKRADTSRASARFHVASMIDFRLDEPVDFAFVRLGSLYAKSTPELLSHFDAVGRALKSGGLYFLDWCVHFAPAAERTASWEMVKDGITVKTTYAGKPVNSVEQTVEENLTLDIEDAGTQAVLREGSVRRDIYPKNFCCG